MNTVESQEQVQEQVQGIPSIQEVSHKEIYDAELEVDSELGLLINNEVNGAVTEASADVSKRFKTVIEQSLVTKIFDRANVVGKAYFTKKVLRKKRVFFDIAMQLAQGGTYKSTRTVHDSKGNVVQTIEYTKEVPPDLKAFEYLVSHIDGSRQTTKITAKSKKRTPTSIDEVVIES